MTKQELYHYKEHSFIGFCITTVKNEGKDAKKEISRRAQHELPFSAFPESFIATLGKRDHYKTDSLIFYVRGNIPIIVIDDLLARALSLLNPSLRDVILLHFFLDLGFTKISLLLDIPPSTVRYRYTAGLIRLKEIFEGILHEKT